MNLHFACVQVDHFKLQLQQFQNPVNKWIWMKIYKYISCFYQIDNLYKYYQKFLKTSSNSKLSIRILNRPRNNKSVWLKTYFRLVSRYIFNWENTRQEGQPLEINNVQKQYCAFIKKFLPYVVVCVRLFLMR